MRELNKKDYQLIIPLIKSNNELSVYSILNLEMEGKVYVNEGPLLRSALVQTSECNYLIGFTEDKKFNQSVSNYLGFWDPITFDNDDWESKIKEIHPNHFLKKYTRNHFTLKINDFKNTSFIPLKKGYYLEEVIPDKIRKSSLENVDEIIDWLDNWGSDELFLKHGLGVYIRDEEKIISYSLTDCSYIEQTAIGIQTIDGYRKKGLASVVVQTMIQKCFQKGYKKIDWLNVEFNQGSIALAKKFDFKLQNTYSSYTPYAPVENFNDFTITQWEEWGEYYENALKYDKRYLEECIYTYVKANNVEKVKKLLPLCENEEEMKNRVINFSHYLHQFGMAKSFN